MGLNLGKGGDFMVRNEGRLGIGDIAEEVHVGDISRAVGRRRHSGGKWRGREGEGGKEGGKEGGGGEGEGGGAKEWWRLEERMRGGQWAGY